MLSRVGHRARWPRQVLRSRVVRISAAESIPNRKRRLIISRSIRLSIVVALLGGGLISLSIAWFDHPVARWVQQVVYETGVYQGAVVLLWVTLFVGGALVLFALGALPTVFRKRSMPPLVETIFLTTVVGIAGLLVAELLKFAIGRSTPYPDYLLFGNDVARPFHLGSFPSGTAAASGAMFWVFWRMGPRFRVAYAIPFLMVCLALVVTNSHWLSDILAGAGLGSLLGHFVITKDVT